MWQLKTTIMVVTVGAQARIKKRIDKYIKRKGQMNTLTKKGQINTLAKKGTDKYINKKWTDKYIKKKRTDKYINEKGTDKCCIVTIMTNYTNTYADAFKIIMTIQ